MLRHNWNAAVEHRKEWHRWRGADRVEKIQWIFMFSTTISNSCPPSLFGMNDAWNTTGYICQVRWLVQYWCVFMSVRIYLCLLCSERNRFTFTRARYIAVSLPARTPTLAVAKWPCSVPGRCTVCRAQSCTGREKGRCQALVTSHSRDKNVRI
jgi:hypothetical protein